MATFTISTLFTGLISEADSTTNWTGSPNLFTSDPTPIEQTGCIGYVVSTATVDAFVTVPSINLSNTVISVWVFARGAMDTFVNGGISIHLGDGTNRIAYHKAGSDVSAFRYEQGPVGWQNILIDTANLPGTFTTRAGSAGNLNLAAITQVGATFKTLAKSVGGVSNCFVDHIQYGQPGLLLRNGDGASNPGTFETIATLDRDDSVIGGAKGFVRKLGAGVYGCQGALIFGDSAGSTSLEFVDTNSTIVFEDRGLGTTRYFITITGNSSGGSTTIVQWGNKSGTGDSAVGTDGCVFTIPTGVGGSFDASNANVDSFKAYGCTFTGFVGGFTLSNDATFGPNHEFMGNTIASCGVFNPGRVVVRNCRIVGWSGAATDAALLWGANADVKRCSFTSSGTGHAIKFTTAGTYTFDGMEFSGYGADGTNNASVYNDSGGLVTINVTGASSGLTVRNGTGASTTINNAVTLTVTVLDTTGAAIQSARVAIYRVSDNLELLNSLTNVSGIASTSFAFTTNTPIYIRVRKSSTGTTRYINNDSSGTITSGGFSSTVTLSTDSTAAP